MKIIGSNFNKSYQIRVNLKFRLNELKLNFSQLEKHVQNEIKENNQLTQLIENQEQYSLSNVKTLFEQAQNEITEKNLLIRLLENQEQ
jgi:hypothetical protein